MGSYDVICAIPQQLKSSFYSTIVPPYFLKIKNEITPFTPSFYNYSMCCKRCPPPPRSLTIEEIAPGTRTSYEFPRHDWDPPFSVGGWVGLGFKLGKHSQEKTRVLPSIPSTMLFASSVLVFCFCFKMDETTCLVDAFKYFLECSSKRSLGEMIHVNDYFF